MSDGGRYQRDVADRQVAMFASFVGPGRHITYAAIEAATGVSGSTWRSYAGGAAMPLHNFLLLADHLPRAAMNLLTEPANKRLVDADKAETNWDTLAADTSLLTSEICAARADGQIDHVERAALKRKGRALIAALSQAVEGE